MIFPPKIASFLELGYFIDYHPTTVKLPQSIESLDQTGMSEEELFQHIRGQFFQAVEELFQPGRTHVVPLSGGLDSRAVLGALLEFTDASHIATYTFGLPGSFDFEIAARVAKHLGVKNVRIPLHDYLYTLEELMEASVAMDHQSFLFFHAPFHRVKNEFGTALHWSGFLGDPITGSHLRGKLAQNMEEGIENFLDFNRFLKGDDSVFLKGGRDYSKQHLVLPYPRQGFPTFEEGLDLLNRQNKYVAPHVMLKGFDHAAPFNNPALMNLFLGLTEDQKREQAVFKKFLQWWKPDLFSIPVKNNQGFPLAAAPWKPKFRKKWSSLKRRVGFKNDPNINYFDFSSRVIRSGYFRQLIWSQLKELNSRNLWSDFDVISIWKTHLNKHRDHGKLIQGLFSLEVHLKAGKKL